MKIILTGATGFVGEGVLLTCLDHPEITEVLMINRRSYDKKHPRLKELIVPDFFKLDEFIEQIKGYDACFFCAGISSAGMSESKYTHITFDTTIAFAESLLRANRRIAFCFISGSHTDSSENGKVMWARVKGKTENALMKLTFEKEYNFRPGGMRAVPGQRNSKAVYAFLVRAIGLFFPKLVVTLNEVGRSMINVALKGYPTQILEIDDIRKSAKGL